MREFDFTLKFKLSDIQANPEDHLEALYESGCDDAVVGVGKLGQVSLNFFREASSAWEAVSSAIADVKRSIPNVALIGTSTDLVGLTEVAHLLGHTRQNMRKLIVEHGPGSPLPVYEGTPALWHLADVLSWLEAEKAYSIDVSLLEVVQTAK
ncbi:hypothetical protein C1752_07852 [Acaryochloris thomasi RCC1774]|uniref:DNA-binding protein n=1 Tax=Acaryochloris thomasi RCC1774 TaxID=1764569 RepID=A0A2W1JLS5_9CYAN|nr:DNA-binding protein [Acaryochloris thomasi]PZD71124.1 hypothetical protein C1752_07852 [Acaryochloris thomasi RCC1774]